jgi:hypothetical protein
MHFLFYLKHLKVDLIQHLSDMILILSLAYCMTPGRADSFNLIFLPPLFMSLHPESLINAAHFQSE